jgi:hypothetical protein
MQPRLCQLKSQQEFLMHKAENLAIAYKDPALPAPLPVPDGPEWLSLLQNIDAARAETLCAAVRTLCPHDTIPEASYRRVIYHLDRVAQAPEAAALLRRFCGMLAELSTLPFPELAEIYRVQALKQIESTAEFFFVQRFAIRYFYDNVEVWAAFGYEGASVHLGGYVHRGFNDLDWLPALPNDL